MNSNAFPNLLIAIVAIILATAFYRKKSDPEKKRREDLASLARKLELQFNPSNDFKLAEKFSGLSWLRRGDVRYAYNVFHGRHLEYPVTTFDYHFSTTAGKSGYDYYWSAYVVEMKTNFPDLMISHESLESRLAEAFGKSDTHFESAKFSHEFRVRCSDKKFAYAVCHPQMMEFLLANHDLTIEINGGALAIIFEDWLRPEKVEANLLRLIEIRKLLPQYLFTNV